jgi:hypothetical protein
MVKIYKIKVFGLMRKYGKNKILVTVLKNFRLFPGKVTLENL